MALVTFMILKQADHRVTQEKVVLMSWACQEAADILANLIKKRLVELVDPKELDAR